MLDTWRDEAPSPSSPTTSTSVSSKTPPFMVLAATLGRQAPPSRASSKTTSATKLVRKLTRMARFILANCLRTRRMVAAFSLTPQAPASSELGRRASWKTNLSNLLFGRRRSTRSQTQTNCSESLSPRLPRVAAAVLHRRQEAAKPLLSTAAAIGTLERCRTARRAVWACSSTAMGRPIRATSSMIASMESTILPLRLNRSRVNG
mmetsp:Transcript_75933/g.158367  ORF Transcript_75933/g.158367 Transcript_75933/m.158367 type:complete len:205 (-) Transcript_75933:300-914(-)